MTESAPLDSLPLVGRYWRPRGSSLTAEATSAIVRVARAKPTGALQIDDAFERARLVLLGEPGAGKSSELVRLKELAAARGVPFQLVKLDRLGEAALVRAIAEGDAARAAAAGGVLSILALDGLDESPMAITQTAGLIEDSVAGLAPSVHLVLTCRTAAWPAALESALRQQQVDLEVAELMPLTRQQVDQLVMSAGLDLGVFRQSLDRAGVDELTRTPSLLMLLLESAKPSGGKQLPRSRAELYEWAARQLATDPSTYRATAEAAESFDVVLSVAGYLATLGVFGSVSAFWTATNQDAPEGCLPAEACTPALIRRWPSVTGVPVESIRVSERLIRTAWKTRLFTGRGEHRLWFAQQTMAEYLAARTLIESKLKPRQVRTLLGERDGLVAPQVQAVAAWLVTLQPGLFRALIDDDPAAFVRSGGELNDPQYRAALADALFQLAERGELTSPYGLDLRQIDHPGLGRRVATYLTSSGASPDARRLAVLAARDNLLADVSSDLVKLALNDNEAANLRNLAGLTALDIDAKTAARALMGLIASGDTDPDVDAYDDLLAVGLMAMQRTNEPLSSMLQFVRRPRRLHYGGRYQLLLTQELPAAVLHPDLPVDELLAAALWTEAANRSDPTLRSHQSLNRLLSSIVIAAATRAGEDHELAGVAATLIMTWLQHGDRLLDQQGRAALTEAQRRALLLAAADGAGMVEPNAKDYIEWEAARQFTEPSDLRWIVDQFHVASDPDRAKIWLECAGHLFNLADAEHQQVAEAEPVDSLLSREVFARPVYIPQRRRDSAQRVGGPSLSELKAKLANVLESSAVNAFATLCYLMLFQPEQARVHFSLDLEVTRLPGWALLDAKQQELAAELAIRHLEQADIDPSTSVGTNTIDEDGLAGVRALVLLCHVRQTPPVLMKDRWELWAPVVVDSPSTTGDESLLREALALVRRHANAAFVAAVRAQSLNQENGWFILSRFEDALSEHDAGWLVELAIDSSAPASTRYEAFRRLLRVAPEPALQLLTETLTVRHRQDDAGSAFAFVKATLIFDTGLAWPICWPVLTADPELAKDVLSSMSQEGNLSPTALREDQAAALWRLMNRLFPVEDDPDVSGAHWVGSRERVARLRDGLLTNLVERGTDAAIEVLTGLASDSADRPWLLTLVAEARRYAARNRWGPIPTGELAAQLSTPLRSIVRNSADLLAVVLEALEEIQIQLTAGPLPEATMLWFHGTQCRGNGTKQCRARSEDDISDHIARRSRDLLKQVVINREVLVYRRRPAGIGERVDILIEVPRVDGEPLPPRVVIEVKGCWNKDVRTALNHQLADRYLPRLPGAAGLYLVAWFNPSHWQSAQAWARHSVVGDLLELAGQLTSQARGRNTAVQPLAAYVLDCTPHVLVNGSAARIGDN